MRSNSLNIADSHAGFHRTFSSTLNKSAFNNAQSKQYYNVAVSHCGVSNEAKDNQVGSDLLCSPTSLYDNHFEEVKMDIGRETSRRSRLHHHSEDARVAVAVHGRKEVPKRDLSMPPINDRQRQFADDNLSSQYTFSRHKYSIDGDLDLQGNDQEGSITDLYDSVITSVSSITPPPVNMIHEYVNRKAIIRPLAFRPVQTERSQNILDTSQNKPPTINKTKLSQPRASPPPVPPHSGRVPLKSGLGRVQSLKSGDSSGYYSRSTVGTANGNTSSTDISPTFDDNEGSMMDSILTGELYANTIDLINDYQITDATDQDLFVTQASLESEIKAERERNISLETALSISNAKQIKAESQINELKMRLLQKSAEVNKTKETLGIVKRSLEHQCQKVQSLEKSVKTLQSLKIDRCKEVVAKEKSTQTNLYINDHSANKLLEQFEEERRTWLDEKLKVLTYQRQIETHFQKLQHKCRRLEGQVTQLRSQMKEGTLPTKHSEGADNSSLSSTDATTRNYFPRGGE